MDTSIEKTLKRRETELEIRQLINDLDTKVKRLEIFENISRSITGTLELDKLLKQIMKIIQVTFDVEATSLFLIDKKTGDLLFYVPTGKQGAVLKQVKLKSGQGIAGWVAKAGTPLLVNDPYKDKRFCPDFDEKTGFTTHSMLAVPLKIREKIIGVIEIINKKEKKSFSPNSSLMEFTDDDRDLLVLLSGQIAVTIDNVRMTEELRLSRDQIREHNKTLEIKIKERTSELEESNLNLQKTNNDLKIAYRKLAEAQAYLLQSEKMACIGQLAAGVAHEINNPIGFISSNLNTLNEYVNEIKRLIQKYEELNPEKGNDYEEKMEELENLKQEIDMDFILEDLAKIIDESLEGTTRVKKIVTDLKDFSHVDESELKYADVNKGLKSTLNIIWNEIKYKATVIKEYGKLPEILCYPMQLNQVFMNILLNAAQAIEKRGEIKISTKYDSKKNQIEICIKDTGSGISAENIKKIFNPFFTTKKVGKGTGLGLSMAYGIINNHKGKIEVKSEVGLGSEFIIKLPVRRIDD